MARNLRGKNAGHNICPAYIQKKTQKTSKHDRYRQIIKEITNGKITDSSGNIFTDLGFNPEQSAIYTLRAELMSNLRKTIRERKWTQEEAAKVLNIGQSRVSDLMRGKWEKFSLDMLITLAIRVGKRIGITVV